VTIFETSYSPLVKLDLTPMPWVRIVTGARGDIFNFNVRNNLVGVPDQPNGSQTKAILSANATMRFVGPRYADEERAQTARGYTLADIGARYRYNLPGGRALDVFLTIENLFNVEWRETQFYDTSRLPGEPTHGVNDIHYTPGNPRTFLGGLALRF
jgi:hypothetical protein